MTPPRPYCSIAAPDAVILLHPDVLRLLTPRCVTTADTPMPLIPPAVGSPTASPIITTPIAPLLPPRCPTMSYYNCDKPDVPSLAPLRCYHPDSPITAATPISHHCCHPDVHHCCHPDVRSPRVLPLLPPAVLLISKASESPQIDLRVSCRRARRF